MSVRVLTDTSKSTCVFVQDSQYADEHSRMKSESMHFRRCGTPYPAATHKHKFFLLCRLISSSGDYYPSPFHSSGRVVAQLDEYLI